MEAKIELAQRRLPTTGSKKWVLMLNTIAELVGISRIFLWENVIVEFDGEQWHSSPSQIAYEAKRDKDLSAMGDTIYRIPSKKRIERELSRIFNVAWEE